MKSPFSYGFTMGFPMVAGEIHRNPKGFGDPRDPHIGPFRNFIGRGSELPSRRRPTPLLPIWSIWWCPRSLAKLVQISPISLGLMNGGYIYSYYIYYHIILLSHGSHQYTPFMLAYIYIYTSTMDPMGYTTIEKKKNSKKHKNR